MIVKTEAVVLHAMKYRETSKILRLFTREYGRVSVIAKGARGTRNKFGAALEPMSHVLAVVYKKEHRDLQLLSQCDVLQQFLHLTDHGEKMATAMMVIELVDAVTHAEERNELLFRLLLEVLKAVNAATNSSRHALYYFELKLLEILGFKPEFFRCSGCSKNMDREGKENTGTLIGVSHTGVHCDECARHSVGCGSISGEGLRMLQLLEKATGVQAVFSMAAPGGVWEEVGRTLRQHLQRHVEGLKRLKAASVVSAIM